MKLEGRKVFGFVVGMIIFVGIFLLTFFLKSDILDNIGGYLIGSILTLSLTFMGVNSLDKIMRSVFYRKELDTENKEEE